MTSRSFVFASMVFVVSSACGGDPGDSTGSTDSDGSTQTGTSPTSTTTTTTDSESDATTVSPTTTSTTTSTSETATTVEPTSTSTSTSTTGGEAFFCDEVDMDGCCEVTIAVEADTFFSDAVDAVNSGCPMDELQGELECQHLSFGGVPEALLFKDDGAIESAIVGTSVLALRFPSADGALLFDGEPIPNELIQAAHLDLSAQVDHNTFAELRFAVHALDADAAWVEGEGGAAVPCVDGLASHGCRECGPMAGDACASPWSVPPGTSNLLGIVESVEDVGNLLEPLDLAPLGAASEWVPEIAAGLVIVPSSSTFKGTSYPEHMPYPGVQVQTRESGSDAPTLRLRLCLP
ncbi:hypothetical protein [Nannocystis punicea]|uniref:Uncharacterized protein n=1 Tax=Nannocystis punicea TaxID=2995304 RepID=A0ABY7HJU6_9BACT|nr:hypothetical protein [Nannocystis poenicansa]WAS99310.1 hypothetical protein O0S08_24545 [Nannocystis poenicansa]